MTAEADQRINDLAMLVRMLAWALRRARPDHELPTRATSYLQRHGLLGSPLRVDSADGLRVTGLAAVTKAWSALPEDLRTDPAMRPLARAINACQDAGEALLQVSAMRDPLERLVAFQRQYLAHTGEPMPGNEHYAGLLMDLVRQADDALGGEPVKEVAHADA